MNHPDQIPLSVKGQTKKLKGSSLKGILHHWTTQHALDDLLFQHCHFHIVDFGSLGCYSMCSTLECQKKKKIVLNICLPYWLFSDLSSGFPCHQIQPTQLHPVKRKHKNRVPRNQQQQISALRILSLAVLFIREGSEWKANFIYKYNTKLAIFLTQNRRKAS